MSEPVISRNAPYAVELEVGACWWCRCGRSANQPFCDGSYKVTEFTPLEFELTERGKVWLSGRKHSKDAPFCDGTHKAL